MPERILVVDDEHEIADLVELYLENEGYSVIKLYQSTEALALIENEEIDLAILDVMMPDIDGFTLCRKIREKYTYPIIMLTAKTEDTDKIAGLSFGADDYITKPFSPLELVARVKAQLRRYKTYQSKEAQEEIIIGGLSIDTKKHECLLDGEPLILTPTEFALLALLASKQGQVISPEDLSMSIWKDEYYEKGSSAIAVHIRHVREKMGESFENPRYIKTIWGVGYKIDAP